MAKYNVTYNCDHSGTVDLTGPHRGPEKELARLARLDCPTCYAAKKATERAAANERSVAEAAEMMLPTLSGSEKQVAWANTLRSQFLARLRQRAGQLYPTRAEALIQIGTQAVCRILEARWWIDRRDYLRADVLAALLRGEVGDLQCSILTKITAVPLTEDEQAQILALVGEP